MAPQPVPCNATELCFVTQMCGEKNWSMSSNNDHCRGKGLVPWTLQYTANTKLQKNFDQQQRNGNRQQQTLHALMRIPWPMHPF